MIRMIRRARDAVRSWHRPGEAGEIHSTCPAGSVTTCTFTPWRRCFMRVVGPAIAHAVALGTNPVGQDVLRFVLTQDLE
jgi:hypothetical protein